MTRYDLGDSPPHTYQPQFVIDFYSRIARLIGCLPAPWKEAMQEGHNNSCSRARVKSSTVNRSMKAIIIDRYYWSSFTTATEIYPLDEGSLVHGDIANNCSARYTRMLDWLGGSCLMRNEKSKIDDDDAQDICGSETSNKLCAVLSSIESVSNNKPSTRAKFSHYPLT